MIVQGFVVVMFPAPILALTGGAVGSTFWHVVVTIDSAKFNCFRYKIQIVTCFGSKEVIESNIYV